MGSPSVFHTAPPQPASKARMTCSPVFAGGAEASQNGLGLLMPAKSIERSAMDGSLASEALHHVAGGVATIRDRVDDLFAAVDAVAAAVDLRVAGPSAFGIGDDAAAAVERDARQLLGEGLDLGLPDGDAHRIAVDD